MRNYLLKQFIQTSTSRSSPSTSLCFFLSSRRYREGPGVSYGVNWALAAKGVIVKDKAFTNLKPSELKQKGAVVVESLSGFPVHVRGSAFIGASKISKAQFGKLIKQVTSHLSSILNIFVHDGAIGSSRKYNAKVRVISDSPSAILSLSSVLYQTHACSVSHDSCPLTVYVATSISPSVVEAICVGHQSTDGFIAADIERSFLVLCGNAFSDANGIKKALSALSEPIVAARGGIPLPGRILVCGDSVVILFAPEDTIQSRADLLFSADAGVVFSPQSITPSFQTRTMAGSNLFKLPTAVVLASSDRSGGIPSISKLSPGQAAYHFLAGYQNGNFVPAFNGGPSSIDPLELAKALLAKLKEHQISSYLININEGERNLAGKEFIELVESALSENVPPFQAKGKYLEGKYKAFLSGKFRQLPQEFSF